MKTSTLVVLSSLGAMALGCRSADRLHPRYVTQVPVPPEARNGPSRYLCLDKQTNVYHLVPVWTFVDRSPSSDGFSVPPKALDESVLQDKTLVAFKDKALEACMDLEYRTATVAPQFEGWGFALAGIGLAGTGGFGAWTAATAKNTTSPSTASIVGLSAGTGLSAGVALLGAYLLSRASDQWNTYGTANAAVAQMKPNDPDGNNALCAQAIQAWATGRAAADATTAGGSGAAKGGGVSAQGGGSGAQAGAGPASGGAGAFGGGGAGALGGAGTLGGASQAAAPAYPSCPSGLGPDSVVDASEIYDAAVGLAARTSAALPLALVTLSKDENKFHFGAPQRVYTVTVKKAISGNVYPDVLVNLNITGTVPQSFTYTSTDKANGTAIFKVTFDDMQMSADATTPKYMTVQASALIGNATVLSNTLIEPYLFAPSPETVPAVKPKAPPTGSASLLAKPPTPAHP